MINKHIFLAALALLCTCQEKMAQETLIREGDTPFRDSRKQTEYSLDLMPQIGITKEEELWIEYPEGPALKISYDDPIKKYYGGNEYEYEKIYSYSFYRQRELNGVVRGYEAVEQLHFTYFFHQDTLVWYAVKHSIIGIDGEWEAGPYDSGVFNDPYLWPGAGVDARKYWDQYTEDERKRIFRENNYIDLFEYLPREHPE